MLDRFILAGAGVLMIGGSVFVYLRDDPYWIAILVGVAGLLLVASAFLLPCHIVRRLIGGF
jgi:hypothetical protein